MDPVHPVGKTESIFKFKRALKKVNTDFADFHVLVPGFHGFDLMTPRTISTCHALLLREQTRKGRLGGDDKGEWVVPCLLFSRTSCERELLTRTWIRGWKSQLLLLCVKNEWKEKKRDGIVARHCCVNVEDALIEFFHFWYFITLRGKENMGIGVGAS